MHARAGTDLELDTTYTAHGNPHVRAMRRAVLDPAPIANASSPALAAVCAEYRLTSARARGGEGGGEGEGESGPCAAGSSTLAGEWLTTDTRLHSRLHTLCITHCIPHTIHTTHTHHTTNHTTHHTSHTTHHTSHIILNSLRTPFYLPGHA